MKESIEQLPVVELNHRWWLDSTYRVAKRVGWWVIEDKYRTHWYVIVFQDGTRSEAKMGTNPIEEV